MNQPSSFATISTDQLADVTGGGLISKIGSLFGPKGAKFADIAEKVFGLFKSGAGSPTTSTSAGAGAGVPDANGK